MKVSGNKLAPTNTEKKPFEAFLSESAVQSKISALVASKEEGSQFMAGITSAVVTTPALARCSHQSILNAALIGQSLHLPPSPQLGYYYMVPFDDKERGPQAVFVLGYKGFVQLAARSGQYRKINVSPIKEGELVRLDPIWEQIEFNPCMDPLEREQRETVGYFAFFETVNGYVKWLYWPKEKMRLHAETYSPGYQRDLEKGTENTFWAKDFDAMGCKTMLRQLLPKWGPMSVDMQRAYELDNQGSAVVDGIITGQTALPEEEAAEEPATEAGGAEEKPKAADADAGSVEASFFDQ